MVQEQLESVVCANSYSDGGIYDVVFSPDGKYIFTTGYDASLSCFKMRYDAAVQHIHVCKCNTSMMSFQSPKVMITLSRKVK